MDAASGMDTEESRAIGNDGTATSTSQPVIQVDKMLQMKKKNATNRPQHIISHDEEQLNPQINQQLKKQQKALQKKARRQAEGGGDHTINNLFEEDDDMMHDEEVSSVPTATTFSFNPLSAPIPDEDEEL
jgi:hypothetical protein